MTLQREQIDTLLAEIDGVLSKANPRLPWVMSSEVTQQRQTLERIRNYLKGLQSDPGMSSLEPAYQPWGDVVPHTHLEVSSGSRADWIEAPNSPQAALNLSQQMMQGFTQDLAQLRSSFLQPLQAETTRLQQQRDSLLQEVRQLERQRQQHTLIQQRAGQEQQVYEFLQGLMDRLQERLSQQINQMVGTIAAGSPMTNSAITTQTRPGDGLLLDSIPTGTALFPAEVGLPPLAPAQRLEQLQMLQARADQIMVTLDTTLRAFAEALQQNIQSYESSLNQGLEKMHTMGQQGEAIVANLVQKLADQVSGQVLSAPLPAPSSSGNRTQGFSTPGFNASSSLPDRQPFTTYASPESDRGLNRFRLSGSTASAAAPSTSASGSSPGGPPPSPATPIRNPDPGNLSPTDLTHTAMEPTQTDLELDLDLLEQLEQSSVSEQTGSAPSNLTSEEPQAGNEELDAFYASLFGDTNRKPRSGSEEMEQPSEFQASDQASSDLPSSDLQTNLQANLQPDANIVASDSVASDSVASDSLASVAIDTALADFDTLAVDWGDDTVERLDLDLEAEEPSEISSLGRFEPEEGISPQTEAGNTDWESSMDPLAALSLSLQIPFQGVTEIAPSTRNAVTNETVTNETVTDNAVTDPLMADLEQALQSFDVPTLNRSSQDLSSPEPSTIAETPTIADRTRPVSIPAQPEDEPIPEEDIINTLIEVLVLPADDIASASLANDVEIAPRPISPQAGEFKPSKSLIPSSPTPSSDQTFEEAGLEESLLIEEEVEGSAPVELYLEPETLYQLNEDLSKLEHQPPEDSETFFDFGTEDFPKAEDGLGEDSVSEGAIDQSPESTLGEDSLEEDMFGEDQLGEDMFGEDSLEEDLFGEEMFGVKFADSTPEMADPFPSAADTPPLEEEDPWEVSSPDESLLPEAEDHSLDWLSEPSSISPSSASVPNLSFDLFGNSALGNVLEEDLDLDSSFEEENELSLDRMTDWFAEEPDAPVVSTEPDTEDLLLIDHLFADLPDAEKKNDWPL